MERPFLSVSLPGGNPQHTVTYKWSLWINLLTDSYSMAAPKKQIISSSWGLSICMELVQHGTARRSNITLLLDSHFLLVSFDLSAFYLGWGCRGRCLLHKTGSGWGCAGQFLEGRWRWGTEKTSDGTNSPPSSWQPARRLRGEGRIGKKGGKQRKKSLIRTKHFKIFCMHLFSNIKNSTSDSSCLCSSSLFEYDLTCCLFLRQWLGALRLHPHSFSLCISIGLSGQPPFLSSVNTNKDLLYQDMSACPQNSTVRGSDKQFRLHIVSVHDR